MPVLSPFKRRSTSVFTRMMASLEPPDTGFAKCGMLSTEVGRAFCVLLSKHDELLECNDAYANLITTQVQSFSTIDD